MKQKLWSRAAALVMTLCMVITMVPSAALAAEAETPTVVSTWSALQTAFTNGGSVKLGANITASAGDEALSVPDEKVVTLDLNGHTLNRNLAEGTYHGYVILVEGELTIQDSSEGQTGKITGGYNGDWRMSDTAGGGIYVDLNGTLNFAGGQITGNKAYSGGGVYVAGTMNMTGGKITNNEATKDNSDGAGGVKIVGGTVKMSAGEISNNTAPRYGAGVSIWSTSRAGCFEMSGGKISGNHFTENAEDSTSQGGGIYVRCSKVVLEGGEISGNAANMGAGVYLKGDRDDASTLTMSNAQISNNTAASSGGGIYADNYSTLTLQSGNIKENKAGNSGAGVFFGSESHGVLSNVAITENSLTTDYKGAGISTSDDVKISGSLRIENNHDAGSKPNNVYLGASNTLKVVGKLEENAAIGITNGGTISGNYAAVGSDDYVMTESDQTKFSSDDTDYAVKPLNTKVEGNRVELGEIGTVTLQSNNVTVASVAGTATLTKKGDSTKAWKKANFVFTVTPAEGYAKTDNFSVEYKPSNSSRQTLTANEDGTYTLLVDSRSTELFISGMVKKPDAIVDVDEGAPKTEVSGLDALVNDPQYWPSGSESVRIVLRVADRSEEDVSEDAAKIKALSGNETLSYLDMSIARYVNNTLAQNIKDTGSHIQAITIAYDTTRKNVSVYRVETEGAVKLAQAGDTPTDGTYRVNDGSITIYTTKFSTTYAIGYTTKSSGSHNSGSTSTTYPVELPKSVSGGTVKADKSSAAKGNTVTITVTPDKGYELGNLTVTDKDGNALSLTSKGNGQYSFTMPAGKVTVTASFAETDWDLAYRNCPKDSTCPIWPYTDAETTAWYHDGVHFCLENGLMVGYGNHIFKPDTSTSRAMLSVMLWRLNGSPVVNYAMTFTDVAADSWYGEAIRWAASQGIVTGYDAQTFGPDNNVTREQMVTILHRYAQTKGYDVSVGENTNILSYADAASVSEYAIPAMQWGCGSGMVQGTDNKLLPQGSTTRAQMATMMMRFCAEIVK